MKRRTCSAFRLCQSVVTKQSCSSGVCQVFHWKSSIHSSLQMGIMRLLQHVQYKHLEALLRNQCCLTELTERSAMISSPPCTATVCSAHMHCRPLMKHCNCIALSIRMVQKNSSSQCRHIGNLMSCPLNLLKFIHDSHIQRGRCQRNETADSS